MIEQPITSILLILIAYLLGSIPTAYLAGRWSKGMDLRRYGSGTVSGSMVWEHVARWAIVPVGLFDVAKATFPAWWGLQLDLGLPVAAAAGLAATIGHNWPVFLRFTGGRGLSCFLGIFVVVFPWGAAWLLGWLAVGFLLGDSAPFALASLVTVPFLALVLSGPEIIPQLVGVMVLIMLIKRLEANRRPLPPQGSDRRRMILFRLLLDRDIRSHQVWIRRRPDGELDTS